MRDAARRAGPSATGDNCSVSPPVADSRRSRADRQRLAGLDIDCRSLLHRYCNRCSSFCLRPRRRTRLVAESLMSLVRRRRRSITCPLLLSTRATDRPASEVKHPFFDLHRRRRLLCWRDGDAADDCILFYESLYLVLTKRPATALLIMLQRLANPCTLYKRSPTTSLVISSRSQSEDC